ncbi:DUF2314 domain-containing protein [Nocardioides sp. NBC_00850]|uniref:DUF2314 domain-containing protein n=1 Tax=Nocardioides sp. NBC_00850 TaxID=2976001 RepID=UPI00386D5202|nr:DUF2314 domain-containing protein [Nocardioides sp. NBC_00850]
MTELLSVNGSLGALAVALLVFGFAPGLFLAAIVKLLHPDDPRRRELQAELYAVPRWERPFWVAEQFEVALREGLFPNVQWYFGRWIWHRSTIESGLDFHNEFPDTFDVPEDELKEMLRPGDRAKLMWSVKRFPGERMWVTITERNGKDLVGTLDNDPIFVHLTYGDTVKFQIDDIIDCILADAAEEIGDGSAA